jgi:glyoxylate reductase
MVSNTPHEVDESTAMTALYLMVSATNRFYWAVRTLQLEQCPPKPMPGPATELEGGTLLVLGLGGIGSRFAHLAHATFHMSILYHSRQPVKDAPKCYEYVPIKNLENKLAVADVVSVHLPLNASTEGFLSETRIRAMKRGAVLVNTARGRVINEEAMILALIDGHVSRNLALHDHTSNKNGCCCMI